MSTLRYIKRWHAKARPTPSNVNLSVQAGCHFEEVVEMLDAMYLGHRGTYARQALEELANALKRGEEHILIRDRKEFLDSLADQIVTAVGVGHCATMDVPTACQRVDESNWSKFDALGNPIFTEQGKIAKGPNYFVADLEGLY